MNISKELLSEVLHEKYSSRLVDWFQIEDDGYLRTYYDCGSYDNEGRPTGLGIEINIHELAHKCKEWAANVDGWVLESGLNYVNVFRANVSERYSCTDDEPLKVFTADTEPEAIFQACAWIKEQKF